MAKIIQFATSRYGVWAAFVISAILVLLIIIQFYTAFTLFFFSENLKLPSKQAHALLNQSRQRQLAHYAHPIAKWHLFGEYRPKKLNAKTLPKSLLNLKLLGVFISTPKKHSKAVIAVPGGEQKVYRVGDIIAAGSKLYRVFPDSVIIQRAGQLEELQLPKKKIIFGREPRSLDLEGSSN